MESVAIDLNMETERLRLRKADTSDIELVWASSRFPGFNDGMTWDPPASKGDLLPIFEKNFRAWKCGTNYVITVELKSESNPIGTVGVHKQDEPGVWSIGFWIHPDYWGRGYATEAAAAAVSFCFEELNGEVIKTDHALWNHASRSVIEKLGFRKVGENPHGFTKNGKSVAVIEYELYQLL